jgi:midasin (ATPase involved in ribosome maturation)
MIIVNDDNELMPIESARKIWFETESATQDLSMELCERLRLILEPTLATKLRGDYRTGKRLNMKKIIPYIASQYKKDKIWLRRTKPSKRQYQVLIAIDDSKSMGESRSVRLAYETMALISKALSRLEVGQVGIVGFGEQVHQLHSFDQPFTDESGVEMIRQLQFRQEKTRVRQLMDYSLAMLERQRTQSNNSDIWQLEIIISDGLCEEHDEIRRLQRMAKEKNILVVFVMLDQRPEAESLLATKNVRFINGKLVMREYMDTFPFDYYVILRDIRGLPETLSNALRQWFEILTSSSS